MSVTQPRLTASARFTGALWGAIVTAIGATTIAVFSGADIDLELLVIVVLAAAGAWLLLSAVATGFAGRKSKASTSAAKGDGADALRTTARDAATSAAVAPQQPADSGPSKS